MESELLELEHAIGYNGKFQNTIHYHPIDKNTLIYNIGGLIVVEDLTDKHNQTFLRGHDMEISTLVVSNTGKFLASGQIGTIFQKLPEAPVIMWSYEKKQPIYVFKGIQVGVKTLAFSPDDRFLAAIGDNNSIMIWDCRDGSPVYTRFYEGPMQMLSWGPIMAEKGTKYPTYMFIHANSTNVFINTLEFDIASMQYVFRPGACQLPSTGLVRNYTFAINNGEFLLAGTTSGEICVFNVFSKLYKASIPLSSNGLLCICLFDDFVYVGGGDGKVKKLNVANNKWNLTNEAQLEGKVVSLNINMDKKELICGTSAGKIYRLLSTDLSYMVHTDAHAGGVFDIAYGDRSDQFATIDDLGIIKLWDSGDYSSLFTGFPSKPGKGASCCIAEDGTLVAGYRDGSLRCFDPAKQALVWEIPSSHRGAVTSVYADANYILSGGEDGAVRIWARVNHKLLAQFNDQKKDIVSLFPDLHKPNQIHSCSMDRSICTYDLKIEKKVNGHQTSNGLLYGMSQRKDHESELVTCGQGAPIYFWDCDEKNPVEQIAYPYKVLTIQVSPKGRFLAFGTETKEVFIFDISEFGNPQQIAKGLGHSSPVLKLKWSPDEKQIISVSADSSICIWNFYA